MEDPLGRPRLVVSQLTKSQGTPLHHNADIELGPSLPQPGNVLPPETSGIALASSAAEQLRLVEAPVRDIALTEPHEPAPAEPRADESERERTDQIVTSVAPTLTPLARAEAEEEPSKQHEAPLVRHNPVDPIAGAATLTSQRPLTPNVPKPGQTPVEQPVALGPKPKSDAQPQPAPIAKEPRNGAGTTPPKTLRPEPQASRPATNIQLPERPDPPVPSSSRPVEQEPPPLSPGIDLAGGGEAPRVKPIPHAVPDPWIKPVAVDPRPSLRAEGAVTAPIATQPTPIAELPDAERPLMRIEPSERGIDPSPRLNTAVPASTPAPVGEAAQPVSTAPATAASVATAIPEAANAALREPLVPTDATIESYPAPKTLQLPPARLSNPPTADRGRGVRSEQLDHCSKQEMKAPPRPTEEPSRIKFAQPTVQSEPVEPTKAVERMAQTAANTPVTSSTSLPATAPLPQTPAQPIAPTPTPPADPLINIRPSQSIEAVVERLVHAQEAGREARPELTLRHREFGAVTMRVEAGQADLKAVLTSRDPAFVPAIQTAIAERASASGAEPVVAPVARALDNGVQQSSGQQGAQTYTSTTGGQPDQRYGSSTGSGQASSQPYREHNARSEDETGQYAARGSEDQRSPDPRGGGIFA